MPHSWSREQTDVFRLINAEGVAVHAAFLQVTHACTSSSLAPATLPEFIFSLFSQTFLAPNYYSAPCPIDQTVCFLWEKAALVLGSMPQSSVDAAQQPVCLVRPPVLCNFAEDWEMLCFRFVMARWCCSTSAPLHMAQQWPLTSQLRRNRRRRMVGAGI